MVKKSKRARARQRGTESTQNVKSSTYNAAINNAGAGLPHASGKAAAYSKQVYIIPDLIRIGIIAAIIFCIEIVLSFFMH
jgi:hypothetical protein